MTDFKAIALECGFTVAEPMDVKSLKFMPDVRSMCAADRCQRIVTHKAADNNTVHCIVELLGHIAQQHGNRKLDDLYDKVVTKNKALHSCENLCMVL